MEELEEENPQVLFQKAECSKEIGEALTNYKGGIRIILKKLLNTDDEKEKEVLRGDANKYLKKAEEIKGEIENGELIEETIIIGNNATGHSYFSVFKRCLGPDVTCVQLYEADNNHQMENVVAFCELIIKYCKNLTRMEIYNISKKDTYSELIKSAKDLRITITERAFREKKWKGKVSFCNVEKGILWIVKLQRGLNYFKPEWDNYPLGHFEFDMRQCENTEIHYEQKIKLPMPAEKMFDEAESIQKSLFSHQQSIRTKLMKILEEKDDDKKDELRIETGRCLDEAEAIKRGIKVHEECTKDIEIKENETGYDYLSVFEPCLNHKVKKVELDETYLQHPHQFMNLVRFCEMVIKHCINLEEIAILTKKDPTEPQWYEELKEKVTKRKINMTIKPEFTLHDREVRFDNGWKVTLTKGLDYFKELTEKGLTLGLTDYYFRQCNATKIFRKFEIQAVSTSDEGV